MLLSSNFLYSLLAQKFPDIYLVLNTICQSKPYKELFAKYISIDCGLQVLSS